MKTIAALAAFASVLAAQAGRSASHTVNAIRHWSLADASRIAIEVSGEFEFRTDRLHQPERVYFDILDARPRLGAQRIYSEQIGDKFVQRVRVAETQPGITRVVLDLTSDVEIATSQLTAPHRLMIELRAFAGPATPTQTPTAAPAAPASIPPAPVIKTEPPKIDLPSPKPPPKALTKPEVAETVTAEPNKSELAAKSTPLAEPPVIEPARSEPPKTESAKVDAVRPPVIAAPARPEEIGKAARHTAKGDNSLIRALGLKITRVVIDPGHGGHDQGTTGPHGLLEKELVLDVSLRLGKLIEDRMGSEVIYTRTDDTFVPLEGRTA
ncbi:MAG TPA: N-acetylmuramoyl-L-alanine amidase, partial [Bryobacteraceae bacterium]